jgi:hypothetical protein
VIIDDTRAIYSRIAALEAELCPLRALVKQARSLGLEADWKAGETLIRDDFFTEYVEDLNASEPDEDFHVSTDPADNHIAVDFGGARYWSTTGHASFLCVDCGHDTLDNEVYMVHDRIWEKGGVGDGLLCIGCLEARLGRPLSRADFTDAPINGPDFSDKSAFEQRGQSTRLLAAMKRCPLTGDSGLYTDRDTVGKVDVPVPVGDYGSVRKPG